ncbi:hypothetical protein A2774_01755 [Candidatus Roizmanbacteria bacterium RIFCSPHIGHO2_01_FULL_39_12c]|uniref:Fimbrial assembly protein n=1 Tax=Candidatus Roizmanbacteria bacterium RIFCSPHIGHO2_01_FULL_39_12c TaxID=1802031 RepID=A0A1F7GB32_9BACT|nr:MAG: hypothetical protein A2774_01755 [Candidatus Roizmanbacteria bacterium RIFCSPHIGHO2_01_FULL_39_12c]OGK46917.1 MAG: hypothetical protein A2963_05165 [Candidatus Roizmanbacteria bacterium RIFCSPLOWO2_01_FULL_40_13]
MKYRINLITKKKEKVVDKLIYFMLNYLRYILVITQIVVIGVFFYRFKIDQELVDLQESTEQKKEIVQISQPMIIEAKKQAFKLDESRSIVNKQSNTLSAIDYLLSLFPESLFLSKLKLTNDGITFVGVTTDARTVNNFLQRLRNEARFRQINLKNIKRSDQGLEFTLEFAGFNPSPV